MNPQLQWIGEHAAELFATVTVIWASTICSFCAIGVYRLLARPRSKAIRAIFKAEKR